MCEILIFLLHFSGIGQLIINHHNFNKSTLQSTVKKHDLVHQDLRGSFFAVVILIIHSSKIHKSPHSLNCEVSHTSRDLKMGKTGNLGCFPVFKHFILSTCV